MRTLIISMLILCIPIALGEFSHTLDAQGEGYLQTSNDVGNNHDRAGGEGTWTYG